MRKILEENKELKQDIESLQNAVVRNRNKIDELTNVIWLFVNKDVDIDCIKNLLGRDDKKSILKNIDWYNKDVEEEENQLTQEEYDLVSKVVKEIMEDE
jgi:hypothetical protein